MELLYQSSPPVSFVVHVPLPFECSFVERDEVRFDFFLSFSCSIVTPVSGFNFQVDKS